jgi:hypothetical protein
MSRLSYNKSVLKNLAKINNKTELKQEKIELSIADDAKKLIANAKQESSKGQEFLKKHQDGIKEFKKIKKSLEANSKDIQKNIVQAEKYNQKIDKVSDKLYDLQSKLIKTADELGVPLKSIPVANDIFESRKELDNTINEIDSILDYNEHLDL